MNFARLLGLGCFGAALMACGGGVSLGDGSQGIQSGDSDGGSSGTGTGTQKDCSLAEACGPALGMPSRQCSDGSIGGSTGKCLPTADGSCGWEVRDCPTVGACFDTAGELDGAKRTCTSTADCATVTIQKDCCGTQRVVGVNNASKADAQKCGDDRASGFPACKCASMGTLADDGSSSVDKAAATVTCSANKVCETTFKADPCAGKILPACERECANFPETGQCTVGDKCRMKGSKIGDACECNGGQWGCAPHPPLGQGCNLVCQ